MYTFPSQVVKSIVNGIFKNSIFIISSVPGPSEEIHFFNYKVVNMWFWSNDISEEYCIDLLTYNN